MKLHRIEQCIPEISSLKEEDAKWKINIKQEPGCALHIKSEMKIKKEPGCPVHTKSEVKISKEPGCENEKPLKHDPGYTPAHDLSDDGDGDVDLPDIIKTEPDESDGRTDEKCESGKKFVKNGKKVYVKEGVEKWTKNCPIR